MTWQIVHSPPNATLVYQYFYDLDDSCIFVVAVVAVEEQQADASEKDFVDDSVAAVVVVVEAVPVVVTDGVSSSTRCQLQLLVVDSAGALAH
jgi:hypothetical protein